MSGFIESSSARGDVPGHIYREAFGRGHDRHSVLNGVSRRVESFAPTALATAKLPPDPIERAAQRVGYITKLRRMDLESRQQAVDFDGEPISRRIPKTPSLEDRLAASERIVVEERLVYSSDRERHLPIHELILKKLVIPEWRAFFGNILRRESLASDSSLAFPG